MKKIAIQQMYEYEFMNSQIVNTYALYRKIRMY